MNPLENVYVTDITRKAIGITSSRGVYRVLAQHDEHLAWPDGISADADGWMYAIGQRAQPLRALVAVGTFGSAVVCSAVQTRRRGRCRYVVR
jgi:hypothetical protein